MANPKGSSLTAKAGEDDVAAARAKAGELFRRKKYSAALDLYLQCAELEPNNAVHFNNISAVRLATEEWELAYLAACKALKLESSNTKAAYRKAKAMQKLRCYAGAVSVLRAATKAAPTEPAISTALKEAEAFAAQAATGSFDLMDLYTEKVKDLADYIGPVKIFASPNGRGVCVTKRVLPGELLFCENPMLKVLLSDVPYNADFASSDVFNLFSRASPKLIAQLHERCQSSVVLSRQVKTLYDGNTPGDQLTVPEMENLIKPFETEADLNRVLFQLPKSETASPSLQTLAGIVGTNSFGQKGKILTEDSLFGRVEREYVEESTLYLLGSFINHSCAANVVPVLLPSGAKMIRAGTELNPGDEIFIHYTTMEMPVSERRSKLRRWNFICKCPRCVVEEQLPKKVAELLNTLAADSKLKEPCGSIGRMKLGLDAANETAKQGLFRLVRARIKEMERAFTSTGLPLNQIYWLKASVLDAYRILRHVAGNNATPLGTDLQILLHDLEIRQAVVPGNISATEQSAVVALRDLPFLTKVIKLGLMHSSALPITPNGAKKLMIDSIRLRYGRTLSESQAEQLGKRIWAFIEKEFELG